MSAPLLKDNVAASLLPHDTPSELIPVRVSGDGNCLFHALKVALANATKKCLQVPTVSDLQRNCADELEKNGAIYAAHSVRQALSVSVRDGDTLHPGSLVSTVMCIEYCFDIFDKCSCKKVYCCKLKKVFSFLLTGNGI